MTHAILKLLGVVCVISSTQAVSLDLSPDNDDFPLFKIDMQTPPRDRFKEVAAHFRDEIVAAFNDLESELPPFAFTFFDLVYKWWDLINHNKYQEIAGIVETVNSTDLTMSKAVMINCLYEIGAWCTSIVAKQADGTVIHARNLDYPHTQLMRDIVYKATFTNYGEYLFDAVMFAGNVGVYTGMRNGSFSVSQNTRANNKHYYGLIENLVMLFTGFEEQSWIIRDALERCDHFDCAYTMLRDQPFNAPGYIITAGTKDYEGVVISRDRYGPAHEDWINETNWFVVQANNDHWKDGCTGRCAAGVANMEKLGQANLTIETIRTQVLEVNPSLNDLTLYNTQFIPSQGFINTKPEYYNETVVLTDMPEFHYKDMTFSAVIEELYDEFAKTNVLAQDLAVIVSDIAKLIFDLDSTAAQ